LIALFFHACACTLSHLQHTCTNLSIYTCANLSPSPTQEAKALRKEAKQREAANLSGGGNDNLTGGAARAAKALEMKMLAASEKQASLAGGATYQVQWAYYI
jgi:hypothetical protein